MCRKGLFYFSRQLSEGPPQKTCLEKLTSSIKEGASPISNTSKSSLFFTILLFVFHFLMYHRSYIETPDLLNRGMQDGEAVDEEGKRDGDIHVTDNS